MAKMNTDEFVRRTAHLSDQAQQAAASWAKWAGELSEMDSHDDGPGQPAEEFLGDICHRIELAADEFGAVAGGQIVEMSLLPHCLFPWEIQRAGEAFASGRTPEEVIGMSLEGLLEEPRPEQTMG